MNAIQSIVAQLAPVVDALAGDVGATCTVLVPVVASEDDAQTTRTYTVGATVNCFFADPDEAVRRKLYGLVEGSEGMLVLPDYSGAIHTLDGFRMETGPMAGTVFVADAAGNKLGVAVTVAVRQEALAIV